MAFTSAVVTGEAPLPYVWRTCVRIAAMSRSESAPKLGMRAGSGLPGVAFGLRPWSVTRIKARLSGIATRPLPANAG